MLEHIESEVPSKLTPRIGDNTLLVFTKDKLHVFDRKTEKTIP